MAKTLTSTGYSGEFDTQGAPSAGNFALKGIAPAQWLKVTYLAGENPITIKIGRRTEAQQYPGASESTVVYAVEKPEDGVSIHFQGKAKVAWEWQSGGDTKKAEG